ncbi:hypothetical protein R6Q59_020643 [Mikania micrantha]
MSNKRLTPELLAPMLQDICQLFIRFKKSEQKESCQGRVHLQTIVVKSPQALRAKKKKTRRTKGPLWQPRCTPVTFRQDSECFFDLPVNACKLPPLLQYYRLPNQINGWNIGIKLVFNIKLWVSRFFCSRTYFEFWANFLETKSGQQGFMVYLSINLGRSGKMGGLGCLMYFMYMPLRWRRINTSTKLIQNTLSDHTERVQLLQGMVSNLVTESVKSKDRLDIAMEHVSVLLSRIRDHPVPSSRYARNDCFT